MLKRLSLLLLCLAAAPFAPAAAADYPNRAIKMVVPFAPGGGTDVLGRIIAQRLSEKLGQPVVVENQPGASGGIGTKAFVRAEADGYTLLMASTGALMAASAALARLAGVAAGACGAAAAAPAQSAGHELDGRKSAGLRPGKAGRGAHRPGHRSGGAVGRTKQSAAVSGGRQV